MTTRLPNLVMIGVSKAGTSSIFQYLGRHSDVDLSDVKEVRYFTPLRYGEPMSPPESYAAHFMGSTARYGMEATPGYFYGGHKLASAIQEVCGDATRVIVSLREPISRCWSWYRFEKSRLRLPKTITFDEYLDRCLALHAVGVDGSPDAKQWWGVGGGCYDQWLDEWVDVFDLRLKTVFFDDLLADSAALMVDLALWLDLDPREMRLSDLEPTNVTQEYRMGAAQRVAVTLNRHGERFFRRHNRVKRLLRSGYYALNRHKPSEQMSQAARERLQDFYRPHNQRLGEQLERIGLKLPASW
jgi:hypothetical protein